MTTKECYEKMGSNYEKVLGRLGSEMIIKKFAIVEKEYEMTISVLKEFAEQN